jgi:phasin
MASSPKKAPRPAVRLDQPTEAFAVEPPTPLDADVSTPALLAAEAAPPAAETVVAATAEVPETPAPQVFEAAAPVPVAEPAPLKIEEPARAREVRDNVRALVEKGLVESRAKFAEVKAVAEEASAAVEASYSAARDGVVALNVKAIEALKAGAEANFDLIASLASAKSVSELVTLQTEFARKRFEDATTRAKALAELARKVADETAAPIKAHVAKTFKTAV